MRAIQITELTGPPSALELVELPEPGAEHMMTPGGGVLIEVRAAGVSFPELLQTRGQYQHTPDLPFVPGSEVAGVVRQVAGEAGVAPGDRVAAFTGLGGWAEVAVAPAMFCFALPPALSFEQGAGLILNYHTAYFALVLRGRLSAGETVLVHGAGGGVGTATLQVAKGLGAQTIAIVSSDAKAAIARRAGADHVLRSDERWREQAQEITDGGVDVVVDPVGGTRFLDSLRTLHEGGRLLVLGFTAGEIPELRVNRLLLTNVEVVGAGWGEYVRTDPRRMATVAAALEPLIEAGHASPIVGGSYPLAAAGEALAALEGREAVGKVVLTVG
jgi:NADPH2:quinone reductase